MAAAPRVALVLTAPAALSTLATVAVYEAVPAGQEGAASSCSPACNNTPTPAGYQPVPADIDCSHQFVRSLQALELCKLCPCVVFPAGGGLHLFGCTKPHVAKTYKALAAAAQPGGKLAGLARLPPVKQSVSLSLSPEVACSVALEALKATLLRCGWTAFDDSLLLGRSFLTAPAGEVCATESVKLQLRMQLPATITLVVQPAMARFRPVSLLHAKKCSVPAGCTMLHECLAEPGCLEQMSLALKGTACSILPRCWQAKIIAVHPPPADDTAHRAWWRAQTGWQLPEGRMIWLEVSFSAEEECDDAATALVPACCAWSASGLNLQPARGAACAAILSRLADNLSGSAFPFWGSKPLVVAGVRRVTSPADLPMPHAPMQAVGTPAPPSPWLTAAQRSSEGSVAGQPAMPCQQQAHAPAALGPMHDILGELQSLQSYVDEQATRSSLSMPSAALQRALEEAAAVSGTPLSGMATPQQPAPQGLLCRAAPAHKHLPTFASRRPAPWLASKPAQRAALPACAPAGAGASKPPAAGASKPAPQKPQLAGRKRAAEPAQAAPRKRPAAPHATATAKAIAPAGVQQAAPGSSSIHTPGSMASQASTVPASKVTQAQAGAGGAAMGAKPARKRAKAGDMPAVQAKARGPGGAAKLSVPEMQCLLRALKLPVGGKKADLLARLEPHMAAAVGATV